MHTGSGRSHETPPLVTPMKAATRSFPSRPASMASPRGSSSSGFDFRAAVLGKPTEKERRWWESSLSSLESVDGLATVARPVLQDLVGLCFNCFSEDHVRAACPNAAKCLRCKEGGHLAIDCTRPRSSKVAPSAAMGAPSGLRCSIVDMGTRGMLLLLLIVGLLLLLLVMPVIPGSCPSHRSGCRRGSTSRAFYAVWAIVTRFMTHPREPRIRSRNMIHGSSAI